MLRPEWTWEPTPRKPPPVQVSWTSMEVPQPSVPVVVVRLPPQGNPQEALLRWGSGT
ncbi:hypothetical protein [Spirillospora sp. NPDC047279]|uniref:hypothetical protein n=1 Tax=Spirillospora sp. NPDC047279 TaxID=3155478 RepID=UPI0033F7A217